MADGQTPAFSPHRHTLQRALGQAAPSAPPVLGLLASWAQQFLVFSTLQPEDGYYGTLEALIMWANLINFFFRLYAFYCSNSSREIWLIESPSRENQFWVSWEMPPSLPTATFQQNPPLPRLCHLPTSPHWRTSFQRTDSWKMHSSQTQSRAGGDKIMRQRLLVELAPL